MKLSVCAVPHNNFETRYTRKHTLIKDDLNLFFFQKHIEMPEIVNITMARIVSVVMDLAVLYCSSVINGSVDNVKMCCSDIVCGCATFLL